MSRPLRSLTLCCACLTAALVANATSVRADVVVVSNRTHDAMDIGVGEVGSTTHWTVRLASGESSPLFSDKPLAVAFEGGRGPRRYTLDPNCVYFFGARSDGTICLQKIGLNETPLTNTGRELPGSAATTPVAVIPVKLLVDEEETSRQAIWEAGCGSGSKKRPTYFIVTP